MCVKTGESRMEDIMKKKFFAFATIALLSVMCLSVFAACTTDVDGKTFVYDSFDIELSDEAKKEAEEMGIDLDKFADSMMKETEEMYSSMEISFKDGKVTTTIEGVATPAVDYEQDGKNITIDGMTAEEYGALTVSSGKLVMEYTEEGMGTVKIIFKQK